MYGTVARARIRAGSEGRLREVIEQQNASMPAGFLGNVVLRTDADPETVFVVGVFESREAYMANADSAEQHARYEQYRALMADEPEWHDGEVITARFKDLSRIG